MESKKDPEKGKKKKEKREKPKYNLWQNTGFMLRAAFNSCKSVPFMCLALALTASGKAVLELLVTPTVLSGLEGGAGLGSLMLTIVLFTAGLFIAYCLENYLKNVALFGRISVREGIILRINKKRATTSYQNILDTRFLEKCEKAMRSTAGNNQATEAIWGTWTDIITYAIGFAVYLIFPVSYTHLRAHETD